MCILCIEQNRKLVESREGIIDFVDDAAAVTVGTGVR